MIKSLRGRLTFWYLGAFTVVLLVFSFAVYFLLNRILYERLDTYLRSTLRITWASVTSYVPSAAPSSTTATPPLDDPLQPNQLVLLLDTDGKVLARKPAKSTVPPRVPASFRPADSPQYFALSETVPESDDSCRGVYQRVFNAATRTQYYIAVVASDEMLNDQLDVLRNVLTGAVLLALLGTGSIGWLLAKRGLLPLATMAAITERITVRNLSERVPVENPDDELGRLAKRFNDLLSRLDQAFVQQRQFMADASHELRTPLSAIRTAAQVTLQQPKRSEAEYREALVLVEKQTVRLSRIVDDLFALTRADMGQLPLQMTDIHLDEVIAEVVTTMKVLAERKGVKLEAVCAEEAKYRGDENLLRRMISNLVDNAIKYTPHGGTVNVSLKQEGPFFEISVSDTGKGIPADLQPHIFERFYRVDGARSNKDGTEGAGLGLSIARSIAHLHRGEITLAHSGPNGSTFAAFLPAN